MRSYKRLGIWLILLCDVLTTHSFAHSVVVHEYITLHAAASAEEFSANYHEFLETIKPADGFLKFSFDGKTKTHDGWMAEGSAREDDQDTDQGGKRSYNHFYDPLSETGLSDYPPDIRTSLMGRNSFVWASVFNSPGLNFTALPGHNVNTINEWSWQNARNFQRLGMSDPNPTVRDENIAKLFRALGDVVHLLQDTSQPQHVRNEQHLDSFNNPLWTSPIERYGKHNFPKLKYTHGMLNWKTAGFTKMEDFWDRDFYTGASADPLVQNENAGNPTAKLGLAEFVNGNFIGVRHTYRETVPANNPFYYPFPSLDGGTDLAQLLANPASHKKSTSIPGIGSGFRYIVGKTGQGQQVTHHGAVRYLVAVNPEYGDFFKGVYDASIDDPDVLKDYHDILIPKAIEYSAGLLDYFFRGKIETTMLPSDVNGNYQMSVKNVSDQDFNGGAFQLFYDDANNLRTEVTGTDFSTSYSGSLANNSSITATIKPQQGAVKYFLIYKGTIGSSGGQALDPVDDGIAVAVKSFTFPDYAWWKMEEAGTADRIDSAQNIPLHVMLGVGATASGVSGKIGNSIKLSTGYNNKAAILRNTSAGIVARGTGVSAVGWFKMAWTTGVIGLRINVNGSPRCNFGMDGNFTLWGNVSGEIAIPTPSYSSWTFFIMDIDPAGTVSLEFNRDGNTYTASAAPIGVGNLLNVDFDTSFQYTVVTEDLYLDEIGIFPRLLTSDEKNYLWNNGSGRTSPIVFP